MNFLKIESANHWYAEQTYGLLVCLTREFLNFGNWDKAYAEDLDYVRGYKLVYEPLLAQKIGILQLNLI